MQFPLRLLALGYALAEYDKGVREVGGENTGPRVREYLKNAGINVPAPWCAAYVYFCVSVVCDIFGLEDTILENVRLKALVQAYVAYARSNGLTITPDMADAGDLVCFDFNKDRKFDHCGFLTGPIKNNKFATVEGNTNDAGAREGDKVATKIRTYNSHTAVVMRWDDDRMIDATPTQEILNALTKHGIVS